MFADACGQSLAPTAAPICPATTESSLLETRVRARHGVMQCQSRWPADGPALADPLSGLQRIQACVMAINSADDERNPPHNPPQLGVMEGEMVGGRFQDLAAAHAEAGATGVFTTPFGLACGRSTPDFLADLIVVISKACRQGSGQFFEPSGLGDAVRYSGVVVQLVRIPACHAGGRGFEPRPLRQTDDASKGRTRVRPFLLVASEKSPAHV